MPRLTSKSRNFSPVGKMGAGRPMSRGSRARSQTAPKASTSSKPLPGKLKSALQAYKNRNSFDLSKAMPASSRRKKSAGAVTRPSMAKGGLNPRARMAQMRRSGRI